MAKITVWAPKAQRIELVTGDRRLSLDRSEDGHFHGPELPAGTDYLFSIDGGAPVPDPRSRWQPQGVHGPSRVFDPGFEFTDANFRAPPLSSAIIYELHVGTFAEDGTFDGVIERLPHLQELGVTHVEIMPIAEFPGKRGWGYDGVYQFAAHSGYGGPLALKRLVNACHARGLAVLLDVVYNHFGPDGNYLTQFAPYLTETFHTPWGAAVNLDGPQSDCVRRYFIDSALQWLDEFHFDGLRLDAVHAMFDRSARHFLQQLAEETADLAARIGKPRILIAESDLNDPRLVRPREAGGFGLDGQWSDDFHHALHVTLTGERNGIHADFDGLRDLAHALERGFVYEGRYSAFRERAHGQPLGDVSLRQLVVCLQNHDQVGNRAVGERIAQLVSPRRALLGTALVLLGPGVPLLFQGEEWAASAPFQYFTDHQNPELGHAVSAGRKREFAAYGWAPESVPDPQDPETFARSRLDFSEIRTSPHKDVFEAYRALIRLRHELPELTTAHVTTQADEHRSTLLVEREASRIAINFGKEATRLPASPGWPARLAYASEGATLEGEELVLAPESFAVVVRVTS